MNNISESDKVLFVDDEDEILNALKRDFRQESFSKLFASNVKTAFSLLEENNDVAVIVTDLSMPGTNGIEFLKKLCEEYPEAVRIVLTGRSDTPTVRNAQDAGHIFRYITKPWSLTDEFQPTLLQAIELHHIFAERRDLKNENGLQKEALKKQEEEIAKLKGLTDLANRNKNKILEFCSNEIKPFIHYVSQTASVLEKKDDDSFIEIAGCFKNKGSKIGLILEKLENFRQRQAVGN